MKEPDEDPLEIFEEEKEQNSGYKQLDYGKVAWLWICQTNKHPAVTPQRIMAVKNDSYALLGPSMLFFDGLL